MIITEQSPFILGWASKRLDCNFGPAFTVANMKQGKLVCVVVYHNFRMSGCEVSIVSDNGLSKDFLKFAFGYAFNFCKLNRLTSLVETSNKESITLVEKLGFSREGLLRRAADNGKDLYIYGMLKEDCRWVANQVAEAQCPRQANTSR